MSFGVLTDLSRQLPDPRDQLDIESLRSRDARALPVIGAQSGSVRDQSEAAASASSSAGSGRAALNIFFRCSNTYTKAFRNQAGDAYLAICPKCGMTKRFIVGPGGSAERTFSLTCQ